VDEFLKSLISAKRLQSVLLSAVIPVLTTVMAFTVLVLPSIRTSGVIRRVSEGADALGMGKPLFVVTVSLLGAVLLYLCQKPLHQFLEGLNWPSRLEKWRRERAHQPQARFLWAEERHSDLADEIERDRNAGGLSSTEMLLRLDMAKADLEVAKQFRDRRGRDKDPRLPRRARPLLTPRHLRNERTAGFPVYPVRQDAVMATRFGNRMRAMERYAVEAFGFDSQLLWHELLAVAPASAGESIDQARLTTDAAVNAWYCCLGFAAATAGSAIWLLARPTGSVPAVIWTSLAASGLLLIVLYRALVGSVEDYDDAVRSLVNTGRVPLAEKLGYSIPIDLMAERDMWISLTQSIYYADDESVRPIVAAKLKKYRSRQTSRNPDTSGRSQHVDDSMDDP
jgi:hypothetical protein